MPAKSCRECPAHMTKYDNRQDTLYGASLGVNACAVKSKLLSTRSMDMEDQDSLAEFYASGCDQYGVAVNSNTPVYLSIGIGIGVPDAAENGSLQVSSCRGCHYFVGAPDVTSNMGINMGLCAKFGNLIPEAKAGIIAQRCAEGTRLQLRPGEKVEEHTAHLLGSLKVNPELASRMEITDLVGELLMQPQPDVIAPEDYVTDAPVSAANVAEGIRAWRKLTQGKREVLIPVFDPMFFSEEERAKIPRTGDDTHPDQYVDHQGLAYTAAVLWRNLDETPALHGVAGTGKTEFFRYMAWMMCLPFERISITKSSEIDDLAGKTEYTPEKGTFFRKGRIPQAWSKPCIIVIDEPNVGPPEVWQFIRPLTDNSKQLVLDQNAGERVDRNENCYMGMAMNPAWDARNVGAEVISDADGSRLMHIFVEYPSEKLERKIIKERCAVDGYQIDNETLAIIMRVAKNLRELSEDSTLQVTWGLRPQIKVARATQFFDLIQAYRLAAADYLEDEQRELILEQVAQASGTGR